MSSPGDLLRLLASNASGVGAVSSIRGVTPGASRPGGEARIDNAEFAQLLEKARSGELTSGRMVSVDPGAGIELDETDLARLSLVADKAEAAGMRRALVEIDGRSLILDVQTRTIVRDASSGDGVIAGIDGVIRVGGSGGSGGGGGVLPPPSAVAGAAPSLAQLLSNRTPSVAP